MPKNHRNRVLKAILGTGLVIAGLKLYSDHKSRQLRPQARPVGRFVEVDGLKTHYLSKGEGRPVVFIHGVNGIIQDFMMSMFDQAASEFHTTVFDRPGHGHSERLKLDAGSPMAQAKAIHAAIKALGIEKPVIVGHSWGGALVMAYALQFPEEISGVVVLAGYVIPNHEPLIGLTKVPNSPILGKLISECFLVPFGTIYTDLYSWPGFYPDPVPEDYIKTVRPYVLDAARFRHNAEDMHSLIPELRKMYPHYGDLKMPVAIVHGEKDRIVGHWHSVALHNAIPKSHLRILPNAGHQLHYTQSDDVMEAIRWVWKQSTENR